MNTRQAKGSPSPKPGHSVGRKGSSPAPHAVAGWDPALHKYNDLDARHLRALAVIYERWVGQLRQKASMLAGTQNPPAFIREIYAMPQGNGAALGREFMPSSFSNASRLLNLGAVDGLTLDQCADLLENLESAAGKLRVHIATIKGRN
jgi:hypothetical protein